MYSVRASRGVICDLFEIKLVLLLLKLFNGSDFQLQCLFKKHTKVLHKINAKHIKHM